MQPARVPDTNSAIVFFDAASPIEGPAGVLSARRIRGAALALTPEAIQANRWWRRARVPPNPP